MLTKLQIDSYYEKGYLAVENVLSLGELQELRKVTDNFVDQSRALTKHTDIFGLEPGHSAESPKVRRIKAPSKQHPVYDHMMRHKIIVDIVAQLIGPDIRMNGDKLNMKSPQGGSPVEWHQDWAFYPHTNDDLLSVGIAIDDMMLKNGPLLVVPGSHKGPLYSHHQNGVFVGAITDTFDKSQAIPLEVKAGGITIHHARTLHGSAPNSSKIPRRLLLFQYCAADAWPLFHFTSLVDFNSKLINGKPNLEARMEAVPVRVPYPAPEDLQGSIYDLQTQLKQSTLKNG